VSTLILKRHGSGVTTLAVVGLRALANEASGRRGWGLTLRSSL